MKYESTILKRLIDTYGVVGNPRYISEIIKEFIVRGKERFPELFTYQADWLAHIDEFGLNPSYTVSYTGQSIYAPNTLERPIKSAILKGNTLVNLALNNIISFSYNGEFLKKELIKPNTEYTLIYEVAEVSENITTTNVPMFTETVLPFGKGIHKIKRTTVSNISDTLFKVWGNGTNERTITIKNLIVIEGDYTNLDIPYFEGMASVQMPGLTTTGKNLYHDEGGLTNRDINSTTGIELGGNRFIPNAYTRVFPGKTYTLYREKAQLNIGLRCYDINKRFINTYTPWTSENILVFETPSNCYYVRFIDENNSLDNKYAIYLGNHSSNFEYEPFKSNILTVNEEVELRGIGDVQDTLDCLTGEVTQRTGEIILNGSEKGWYGSGNDFRIVVSNVKPYQDVKWGQKTIVSNLYPSFEGQETDCYIVTEWSDSQLRVHDVNLTLKEFKDKLAKQPLYATFLLSQESIKTVDLTVTNHNGQSVDHLKSFNGGTHVYTSSLDGSLVPSVDISVETDLEETLKMCSLDGNTM